MEYNEFKTNLEAVYQKIKKAAEKAKMDAGYNGSHTDGGASRMLSELKMYQMGFNRTFPSQWKPYLEEVKNEQDPEWNLYQKLKEKFEN